MHGTVSTTENIYSCPLNVCSLIIQVKQERYESGKLKIDGKT